MTDLTKFTDAQIEEVSGAAMDVHVAIQMPHSEAAQANKVDALAVLAKFEITVESDDDYRYLSDDCDEEIARRKWEVGPKDAGKLSFLPIDEIVGRLRLAAGRAATFHMKPASEQQINYLAKLAFDQDQRDPLENNTSATLSSSQADRLIAAYSK